VANRSLATRKPSHARVAPPALAAALASAFGLLLLTVSPLSDAMAQDALLDASPPPDGTMLRRGLDPVEEPRPAQADPYAGIDETMPDRDGRTAPNYGAPRPAPDPRAAYRGRPSLFRQSLPPLETYPTAPRQARPVDGRAPAVQYARPAGIARRPRPQIDADPYAPLGIDLGAIRVLPFVEIAGGYDTNAARSALAPTRSALTRIDAGFSAFSLWSRHEFRADVAAGYFRYFADPNASRPDGTARASLRLDATRDTRIDLELRGALTTQRPGSPELNAPVTGRPAIVTYGAGAGVTQTLGRAQVSVNGLVERTDFSDATLTSGATLRLSRDNYTAYGLRGRASYEITPGVRPFVEVTGDLRRRDEPVDAGGFARNSSGVGARAGGSFEISRILTGEASVGYARRTYADPRLPELAGVTVDASLVWTATPLTTLTLRAESTLNETTIANAAGSVTRRGSLTVSHALLRNLDLSATALWQNNDYRGISLTETIYEGRLQAAYSLTRSVVVKGSFNHTRLKSSRPGADYTANVFLLGLRLQR